MRRKFLLIAFIILTIVNAVIFLFRDHFAYQPYADYSALYKACDEDCIKTWKQAADDEPPGELTEAKKITDSVTNEKFPTIDKIFSLGKFLHNRFSKQLGKPAEFLSQSSAVAQYKKLCASDSEELWCGNFAAMFYFFAWSKGITTRTIEIMFPGDHHVLNECYVPEINKWVMVDVTTNIILVQHQNQFLDLISFEELAAKKEPIYAFRAKNNFIEKLNVIPHQYLSNVPIYYYHRTAGKKVYTAANKIKRYFLPVSWYNIFDDKKRSNLAFYLKAVFSFLWLISFFALLFRTKFKL